MGRWPEPVREPLPVRPLTEADIEEALALTVRYLDDPEDPAFDQATFGFVCATRAALVECAEVFSLAQIGRRLDQEGGEEDSALTEVGRLGREYVAQKVARRLIQELRRWVPLQRQ